MLRWEQISDETMAYCDLKEDPMFSKIKNKELYIKGSFAIAEKVASQYAEEDLAEILRQHHVPIYFRDNEEQNEVLFSQIQSQIYYEKNCKMIELFLPCIRIKTQALKQYGYQVSFDQLLSLHIAHEFYHFHEYEYDRRTYELLPKIDYLTMNIIHRKAAINRCSEIAAHRFAQVITKITLHPKLMDYMYLIKRGIYQENEVLQIVTNAGEILQGGTK